MVIRTVCMILFLGIAGAIGAQNVNKEIEDGFLKYNQLIIEMKFEKAMDYAIPEMFDYIPRSSLIQVMEATFNNPDLDFKIGEVEVLSVSDVFEAEGRMYALLDYRSTMLMDFPLECDETGYDTDEALAEINTYRILLAGEFGEGNVQFHKDTGDFEIEAKKKAIAGLVEGSWKYLVVDKDGIAILREFVPTAVMAKL